MTRLLERGLKIPSLPIKFWFEEDDIVMNALSGPASSVEVAGHRTVQLLLNSVLFKLSHNWGRGWICRLLLLQVWWYGIWFVTEDIHDLSESLLRGCAHSCHYQGFRIVVLSKLTVMTNIIDFDASSLRSVILRGVSRSDTAGCLLGHWSVGAVHRDVGATIL